MNRQKAHKKTTPTLPRLLYRWHRRIGAAAALFVVWIVITGIMLNHGDELTLSQYSLHNSSLAHWYNLNDQLPSHVFVNENHWLGASNNLLVLDGEMLKPQLSSPIGIAQIAIAQMGTAQIAIAQNKQLIAIANQHEIILLDAEKKLIDRLNESSLPITPITKIGNGCSGIAISNATQTFSTQDGIEWQPCAHTVTYSRTQSINTHQLKQLEILLIPEISLEKLIIDLHTGRFFGSYGAYAVDLVAVCLLLLALSGLWLFFRNSRKK
jgi:hypothetical protein